MIFLDLSEIKLEYIEQRNERIIKENKENTINPFKSSKLTEEKWKFEEFEESTRNRLISLLNKFSESCIRSDYELGSADIVEN